LILHSIVRCSYRRDGPHAIRSGRGFRPVVDAEDRMADNDCMVARSDVRILRCNAFRNHAAALTKRKQSRGTRRRTGAFHGGPPLSRIKCL